MKNKLLTSSFFLALIFSVSGQLWAQESKNIKGKTSFQENPLSNVTIVNLESKVAVKSDSQGNYEIIAKVGESISFSYVGLKTVEIVIEDITSILNVELTEETTKLDDVVVKARVTDDRSSFFLEPEDINIITPFGTINPKKSGFSIVRINGDRLPNGFSLVQALAGKTAGLEKVGKALFLRGRPVSYIIDDMPLDMGQVPDIALIKDVYIIKNRALIVLYTENHPRYAEKAKKKKEEKFKNQNFYDETSVTETIDYSKSLLQNPGEIKEISGKLTTDGSAVPDVLITIAGNKDFKIYSDKNGKYKLKVAVGDIVQFTHASFETVSLFIEDDTEIVDIKLREKITKLEEVFVEMNKPESSVIEQRENLREEFTTSRGNYDPKKSGLSQTYIDGKRISNVYPNIQEALVGKITGYTYDRITGESYLRNSGGLNQYPVAWEIDEIFTTYAPSIDLNQVKSVRALKSLASTNRYGSQAAGGVIIIKTIFGNFRPDRVKKNSLIEEYANSNYYEDDAAISTLELKDQNKFSESLSTYKSKVRAYKFYQDKLRERITNYGDHISVAVKFLEFYKDKNIALEILNETARRNYNDPEALKAVAYHYQMLDQKKRATKLFERVFKLRPQHAQSFRDLANAYVSESRYTKAWKLYYAYMTKGKVTSEEGIGELMYNDMEWMYYKKSNQSKFKRKFVPIYKTSLEFERDVRMVFEWNTSEAEFELEFVSPDRRAYVFDHSLSSNSDLIVKEKKLGYSSKMFVVEDLGNGEWLVNLTYKGNKKPDPTYLKLTTYYNWGKPSEKRSVKIYKLDIEDQKASLFKLSKDMDTFRKVANN